MKEQRMGSFDSPLPLVENKENSLSVNDPNSRFISVEGPPGTGKSHTISVIALINPKTNTDTIGQKEALDLVEDKIDETLENTRPDENFSQYLDLVKQVKLKYLKNQLLIN